MMILDEHDDKGDIPILKRYIRDSDEKVYIRDGDDPT